MHATPAASAFGKGHGSRERREELLRQECCARPETSIVSTAPKAVRRGGAESNVCRWPPWTGQTQDHRDPGRPGPKGRLEARA
eukprot:scaffold115701_cov75-Phaeocystis_antarctica.AAC.2